MRAPAPMLASPAGDLPPLQEWTLEPKWDGARDVRLEPETSAHALLDALKCGS